MTLKIKRTSSERNRHLATDDYEGVVNGKSFFVQIDACRAPNWYDSKLSEDEKNEVLNEIEYRERNDAEDWASKAASH